MGAQRDGLSICLQLNEEERRGIIVIIKKRLRNFPLDCRNTNMSSSFVVVPIDRS